MLRKLALGLIAAVSLSAMALAPSAASAKPWGWGGGWGDWGGYHHYGHGFAYIGGPGYDVSGCYVTRRILTPFGYRLRTFNVCG